MKREQQQSRVRLGFEELKKRFPWRRYPEMRSNQEEALKVIAEEGGSATLELPTGSGKTAVGYTPLRALELRGMSPLFYIVPTKALVEQARSHHPDVRVAYGRHEHLCLYYKDEKLQADEIPCLTLLDCPHRVDQETGKTFEPGAVPCPYYQQKYEAKQGGIVASTVAFYLFTHLFSREFQTPAGLVIDEAHRVAQIVRSALSFEITDWHVGQAVELLEALGAPEAAHLKSFLRTMLRIIKRRPAQTAQLLEDREIRQLMEDLQRINAERLRERVGQAVKKGLIDPKEKREVLKQLEVISHDIPRYLRNFEFSLPTPDHGPLHYTFAYWKEEREAKGKVQYKIVVKAYYVAPLIRKRLLSPNTVAYSATIGDPGIFGFETGIELPFHSFPSPFPVKNTRVFLPADTPNLAVKARSRRDLPRALRQIAKACRFLARHSIRSLVVVVSEVERRKFVAFCEEEEVAAVSYGNGTTAKEAVAAFKAGKGEVLVGTVRQFGEGIDLPGKVAQVTFFLRPAYPRPDEPETVFETRRFGLKRCWELWNWRVMLEALQVRGRNVRSEEDLGVTFFISQQFRRFLYGSLPEWLKPAYQGDFTLAQGLKETVRLLQPRKRVRLPVLQ